MQVRDDTEQYAKIQPEKYVIPNVPERFIEFWNLTFHLESNQRRMFLSFTFLSITRKKWRTCRNWNVKISLENTLIYQLSWLKCDICIYVSVTFFISHDKKCRIASSTHWILRCRNITLSRCSSETKLENHTIWSTLRQLIITLLSQITQLPDKCLRYPADSTNADGIRMAGRSKSRWQSKCARELLLSALCTSQKVHVSSILPFLAANV